MLRPILTGSPNSAFLQFWSNRSGSDVSSFPTPRIPLPASGMHLFECEVSIASQYQTAWVDGPQVATLASFPHSAFTVDRIGQGTGATLQFVGQMGGMTGVITGPTRRRRFLLSGPIGRAASGSPSHDPRIADR